MANLTLEELWRGASDADLIAEAGADAAGRSALTDEALLVVRSEIARRGLAVPEPTAKWICEQCKHWNYGRREAGCGNCANREPSPMTRVPWKIGGDIGNKAVLEYIVDNVDKDEEVVATLLGLGEKTGVGALFSDEAGAALGGNYLLVTNRKVVVVKAGVGVWGTGSVGLKAKTFLYEHIASVDVAKRWISGEIEIVSAGMVEKGSGGFFAGAGKDSVVQFEKKYFDDVQKLAREIQALSTLSRQPKEPVPHVDVADQIKKLAELRSAGVLTEQEFAEQKRKLLSRL